MRDYETELRRAKYRLHDYDAEIASLVQDNAPEYFIADLQEARSIVTDKIKDLERLVEQS